MTRSCVRIATASTRAALLHLIRGWRRFLPPRMRLPQMHAPTCLSFAKWRAARKGRCVRLVRRPARGGDMHRVACADTDAFCRRLPAKRTGLLAPAVCGASAPSGSPEAGVVVRRALPGHVAVRQQRDGGARRSVSAARTARRATAHRLRHSNRAQRSRSARSRIRRSNSAYTCGSILQCCSSCRMRIASSWLRSGL